MSFASLSDKVKVSGMTSARNAARVRGDEADKTDAVSDLADRLKVLTGTDWDGVGGFLRDEG